MRLVKFKLASLDRFVYINTDLVESVSSVSEYNSYTNEYKVFKNECFISMTGSSDSTYRVSGSLENVIGELLGD